MSEEREYRCLEDDCKSLAKYNMIDNVYTRCEEHKYVTKYNQVLLDKIINHFNIELIKIINDNKEQKKTGPKISPINCETIIIGKCKYDNCNDNFEKSFRDIIKYGRYYCREHQVIIGNKRRVNTTQKKYNVNNVNQSDIVRKKSAETCQLLYNAPTPFQSQEIRERIKQTNINNFGGTNPSQNPEVQKKKKQNNISKYGTPSLMQVPHIRDKIMKNAYKRKIYTSPLGNQRQIQGYENYALDYLFSVEKINEEDILYGAEDTSEIFELTDIWYIDKEGINHPHYVDIYIKSQKRCVEVKSTWTALKKKDNIFLKKDAAERNGLIYEIWIYNDKGHRVSDDYINKND
jgi:hypothetical protein